MEKVRTVRDSVGCALMAAKFPGIPIGEINPTLSRPVLTSSKMDSVSFREAMLHLARHLRFLDGLEVRGI